LVQSFSLRQPQTISAANRFGAALIVWGWRKLKL